MDESRKSFNIQYSIFNILLSSLLIISFLFRVWGLSQNFSFWSDEAHVVIYARRILEIGKPVLENSTSTGTYQLLLYYFVALSMKVFGANEFAARLPMVVFGSLTVLAIYLLGKELFGRKVGLLAAFLTAFLKIEILWSRQARPYQTLQLFFLLGSYFLYKYLVFSIQYFNKKKEDIRYLIMEPHGVNLWYQPKRSVGANIPNQKTNSSTGKAHGFLGSRINIGGFLLCATAASLFHGLGLVLFFDGILYLILLNLKEIKKFLLPLLLLFSIFVWFSWGNLKANFLAFGKFNNFDYHRIFLTKNYLTLAILGTIGGLGMIFKKEFKKLALFSVFLGVQGFIVSFLLGQPFVRYFYIIFPFIILLACSGVNELTSYVLRVLKIKKSSIFSIQYSV
ncbi:glycosyltransferase family 39 protein, partial [Patescibacteria group bacterium]|nr:glycosyltransferase family 39 protein [Patescibacteria group bacterium]